MWNNVHKKYNVYKCQCCILKVISKFYYCTCTSIIIALISDIHENDLATVLIVFCILQDYNVKTIPKVVALGTSTID